MSRARILCVVFVCFNATIAAVASAADPPLTAENTSTLEALTEQLDDLLAKYPDATKPGGAIGVAKGGELIYGRGFGAAHVGYQALNDTQTLFDIASASKSFTTACVAILMDQGKLKPDDDIRDIVPEMNQLPERVTIRNLLRCESGIWAQVHIMPLTGRVNVPVQHPYNRDDILAVLSSQRRLPFKPGTDHEYSSSDFFLLALAVENVSGLRFPDFAKKHLFEPCGMKRTFAAEVSEWSFDNRAVGHWDASNDLWRTWLPNGYMIGGGGVNTCVDDLVQWDRALRNHLSPGKNRLPRGKYVDEFVEEGCILGNRFNLDAIAFGMRRDNPNVPRMNYRGARRVFFTGGYWGLACCMARFPDHDVSIICLTNNDSVSPIGLVRKAADLVLAEQLDEVVEPTDTSTDDNTEKGVELTSDQLQNLVGDYRRRDGIVWSTKLTDNQLQFTDHLGNTHKLDAITESEFRPIGPHFGPQARFEFHPGKSGRADSMTQSWRDAGRRRTLEYTRVEIMEPERLEDFAGQFYSPELNLSYLFRIEDDALWLRVGSGGWEELRPSVKDEFTVAKVDGHDQRKFRFLRNEDGSVRELSIKFWRIRDLRLAKMR